MTTRIGKQFTSHLIKVAFYYESSSEPGKFHETTVDLNGRLRCSCRGFFRYGHCRHTKQTPSFLYRANEAKMFTLGQAREALGLLIVRATPGDKTPVYFLNRDALFFTLID